VPQKQSDKHHYNWLWINVLPNKIKNKKQNEERKYKIIRNKKMKDEKRNRK